MLRQIDDSDDDEEHIRPCPECGMRSLWVDTGVRQGYCLECRYYVEYSTSDDVESAIGQVHTNCPDCGAFAWSRKTKTPKFRCGNGHEFNQP